MKNNEILLSIIVPVYNTRKYLERSLGKLVFEMTKDVELIIVNDGSTDDSMEFVDALLDEHSNLNIKKIVQKNMGLSEARNTGVRNSSGEYIFFVDSDDVVVSGAIKSLLAKINQSLNQFELITFDYEIISEEDELIKVYEVNKSIENNQLYLKDIPNPLSNVWRYVIERRFYLDNSLHFRPNIYCEDIDWCTRMYCAAPNITKIEQPGYRYRKNRSGSIMSSFNTKRFEDTFSNIGFSHEYASNHINEIGSIKTELVDELAAQYYYTMCQLTDAPREVRAKLIEQNKSSILLFKDVKTTKSRIIYMLFNVFGFKFAIKILSVMKKLSGLVKQK